MTFEDALVCGHAQVHDNAWDSSPLHIVGSLHSLTNCKRGHIHIGCHCKTFDEWLSVAEKVGKDEGYSESQIAEYIEYINLFKRVGK